MARYICLLRLPFAGNKHVKIRPSYHERIREITRVFGRGDVTITAYVDKVLKAHLDDNRETIERLFEEREAVASRPVSYTHLTGVTACQRTSIYACRHTSIKSHAVTCPDT